MNTKATNRPTLKLQLDSKSDNTDDGDTEKVVPLYEYLNLSKAEYNEFSEFLTSCFALENLLFFVKAIAFRHIVSNIVKQKGNGTDNDNAEEADNDIEIVIDQNTMEMDRVYALDFKYLDIDLQKNNSENDTVQEIAIGIYEKYISMDGIYPINISAEVRRKLNKFFNCDHEIMRDYCDLFDQAIEEVYGMLNGIYGFQFNSYRKRGS